MDLNQMTILQLIETWNQLSNCIAKHPEKLIEMQMSYWKTSANLSQEFILNSSTHHDDIFDKRFSYKNWQDNISFYFIKKSYLLLANHIKQTIKNITVDTDIKIANRLLFYSNQFIDAISPSNFAHLNPEVLSKTLESNGINLIQGMKHFLENLENGNQFNIQNTDLKHFKLGENIACTPGNIIYQNELMQLIQYNATTKKIYQYPLLIIPPWINKYYILDLQPENSLIKYLVDKGITVFVISWINPNINHRDKRFDDYLKSGPLTALNIIRTITRTKYVNLLGYCIGGTLLGCLLAYLRKKNDNYIKSATFLTTLFDFSEPGEIGLFIDKEKINLIETSMAKKGYLDGSMMASVFNALRANDLIWSTFVNHYLKGEKLKPFDLLYWNADATNIPAKVHSFYLRNMYLKNALIQSDKIKLVNTSLDLSSIKVPGYFLATQEDHIVPWQSAYTSSQFYGGKEVKFVLTTSGHVAGVINPPHRNKYGYWTNINNHNNSKEYLESANFTEGSWWNHWICWLKKYSGKLTSPDHLDNSKHNSIEKAPGSYVKVRLNKIEPL